RTEVRAPVSILTLTWWTPQSGKSRYSFQPMSVGPVVGSMTSLATTVRVLLAPAASGDPASTSTFHGLAAAEQLPYLPVPQHPHHQAGHAEDPFQSPGIGQPASRRSGCHWLRSCLLQRLAVFPQSRRVEAPTPDAFLENLLGPGHVAVGVEQLAEQPVQPG